MVSNFQPGQNVVIIQTFKTPAYTNARSAHGAKLKFQAGRKGTFVREINVPQGFRGPQHYVYAFILPYGATRYEVRLSLDEAQKFLAAENEPSGYSPMPSEHPLPVFQAPQVSRVDEILKLAELKERGLLTDEEFTIEKSRILNQSNDAQSASIQTGKIENLSGSSSNTHDVSQPDSSTSSTSSTQSYYVWILKFPPFFGSKIFDEFERICGLPSFTKGIKPKHQPEILSQRNELIDLRPLAAFSKNQGQPVRLNKVLNHLDAVDIVSELRRLGIDAEFRTE
jgi:hypothetical protein